MNRHTPAPWEVREGFLIHHEEFGQIAALRGAKGSEELAGNTRVIAAAPELLAALRLAYDQLDCICQSEHVDQDMIDAHEACRLVLEKVQS